MGFSKKSHINWNRIKFGGLDWRIKYILFYFLKILFIHFQGERGRGRERNIDVRSVREKHKSAVSHMHPNGDRTATQACAPTGNRTSNPSVWRMMPNPLSHTSEYRIKYTLNVHTSSSDISESCSHPKGVQGLRKSVASVLLFHAHSHNSLSSTLL